MTRKQGRAWIAVCFMIYCLAVLSFLTFCSGCAEAPRASKPRLARVTFYNKHEDRWGSRIAMSSKLRAKAGETVAAERCCFPFGTRLYFPDLVGVIDDGIFTVQDRGSAVERRVASHGKYEVCDIYAGSRRQMRRWMRRVPPYLPYYRL